ncbi:hypothetical protein MKW92_050060 [Papaver armeniacum]|nr:hypothetical protein MKW92_050060 [Papaver armeniacum]
MKKDFKGFSPVTPLRVKSCPCTPLKPTPSSSEKKKTIASLTDSFHSPCNKVPTGDSPYVKAKHVQIIEKDPSKAIPLFWSAINCGDRVDSAVLDMAVVMKQLNRAGEAIEAIKSFRSLCSQQAQESLDNVLIDLYKRAGRIDEHIELLQHKLQLVEDGGQRTKIARAQGKKYLCSIEHEKSRLLGNLGWAYMQQENYQVAEELYRKALSIEPDKNKECNLAICLMHKGRIMEARSLLLTVKPSAAERELADSYIKSFDRATEMLSVLDSGRVLKPLEQKKDDNIKLETQGCFTPPVKVNFSSPVSSRYGDQENNELGVECVENLKHQSHVVGVRGLKHSDSRVSSTTKVQQTGIRRCLDNSHPRVSPVSGQYQNHGFGGKCRAHDSHLRVSPSNGHHQKHGFGGKWREENSHLRVSPSNGQHQNHGFGRKWREEDPHFRVSPSNGQRRNHGFGGKWREENSHSRNHEFCGKWREEDLNKVEKPTLVEEYSGSETTDSLMSSTPMSQEGMNGADSGFGNWKPLSSAKSGKSWADMVEEEEEEERLSRFSDYSANMVESVSDWSSSEDSSYMSQETRITSTRLLVDKWYEKNEAVYSSDNLNSEATTYLQLSSAKDIEDNLQRKFEAVDINGEFRKPAARRSLYFDQKQEQEPSAQQYLYSNTHECAGNPSTISDWRKNSTPLKVRL